MSAILFRIEAIKLMRIWFSMSPTDAPSSWVYSVSRVSRFGFNVAVVNDAATAAPAAVPSFFCAGAMLPEITNHSLMPTGTESTRTPKMSKTPGAKSSCKIGRWIVEPSLALVVVNARISASPALRARVSGVRSMSHGTATPPCLPTSGSFQRVVELARSSVDSVSGGALEVVIKPYPPEQRPDLGALAVAAVPPGRELPAHSRLFLTLQVSAARCCAPLVAYSERMPSSSLRCSSVKSSSAFNAFMREVSSESRTANFCAEVILGFP